MFRKSYHDYLEIWISNILKLIFLLNVIDIQLGIFKYETHSSPHMIEKIEALFFIINFENTLDCWWKIRINVFIWMRIESNIPLILLNSNSEWIVITLETIIIFIAKFHFKYIFHFIDIIIVVLLRIMNLISINVVNHILIEIWETVVN